MSSAEMIVLFLSLRYFVIGELFRFRIPSKYIFLSGAAFSIQKMQESYSAEIKIKTTLKIGLNEQ
jgi:hypothetical protein